ncbi:hypothetical protein DF048_26350 [Burkholderia seminalis]|nr:hypothetical protein DF032_30710 [Burkholderia seminalis]RQS88216.1 hypothetical protein DF048_26350 [Burkholderia seminalis]
MLRGRPEWGARRLLRSPARPGHPLATAPSFIPIRPAERPSKPAAQMKKPRQRGVCDVLRF